MQAQQGDLSTFTSREKVDMRTGPIVVVCFEMAITSVLLNGNCNQVHLWK